MLERKDIVINTGPIIALVAALDDLSILRSLYRRVLVPYEACQEIEAGGPNRFAAKEFEQAFWLEKWRSPMIRNDLNLHICRCSGILPILYLIADRFLSFFPLRPKTQSV